MKKNNLSSVEKISKKSKINKADIFIYILAIVAFILMVFVLIANRTQDLSAITYLFSDNDYIEDFKTDDPDDNIQSEIISNDLINNKEVIDSPKNFSDENEIISQYSFNNHEDTEQIESENIDELEISKLINNDNDINNKDIIDNNNNESFNEKSYKPNIDNDDNGKSKEILDDNSNLDNDDNEISIKEKLISINDTTKSINEISDNNKKEISNDTNEDIGSKIDTNNHHKEYIVEDTNINKNKSMTYIVKKGDAIWKIADKFNITNDEIIDMNELENPDLIYPGQEIIIPNDNYRDSIDNNVKEENNSEYLNYSVEKGDAIWKIADKYNVASNEIINVNNLENPDLIYPEQTLIIPINRYDK